MNTNLPFDIMLEIVTHLEPNDRRAMRAVAPDWRAAVRAVEGDAALREPLRIDAFLGSEAAVKWAVANGCPLTPRLFRRAVKSGNLGTLYALYELKCPRDASVCMEAATHENLDALMWMRSRKFDWNFLVCFAAAGSVTPRGKRMLRWLSSRKSCPCKRAYH
jgi:hypothetical protein